MAKFNQFTQFSHFIATETYDLLENGYHWYTSDTINAFG